MTDKIKKLIERGMPVKHAIFQNAVNNGHDAPEHYFSTKSANKSRQVQMWWINGDGLLYLDNQRCFMTSSANVKFHEFELE